MKTSDQDDWGTARIERARLSREQTPWAAPHRRRPAAARTWACTGGSPFAFAKRPPVQLVPYSCKPRVVPLKGRPANSARAAERRPAVHQHDRSCCPVSRGRPAVGGSTDKVSDGGGRARAHRSGPETPARRSPRCSGPARARVLPERKLQSASVEEAIAPGR